MKKILLSSALLITALLMTVSCVKDTESDSVKQIRNAKANALQAEADFLKAQAAALKLTSEANAAGGTG